tara:strand:+ start:21513 stop:21803 length:291 start_codon:yes stop_codon:yes gene_type:complete
VNYQLFKLLKEMSYVDTFEQDEKIRKMYKQYMFNKKEVMTKWKDKRIAAINRWSKKKGVPCSDCNPYFNEYNAILDTKAITKQEYKKERKNNETNT